MYISVPCALEPRLFSLYWCVRAKGVSITNPASLAPPFSDAANDD